jgi:hypothetical protein
MAAVGCALAAALAQAVPAAAAGNTITQTAITSPADPSYFYDPTAGAYGAITVTGTTNSTNPSLDRVDILCYIDNGASADPNRTPQPLLTGVALNSSGGFSATVPYSAVEQASHDGECRLRAVPSGTAPTSGLASFAGPRILLSYLAPAYSPGSPSYLYGYQLTVPELGAIDTVSAAGSPYGCGLGMALASPSYFGDQSDQAFDCADWFMGPNYSSALQVDGQTAQTAALNGSGALTVSASQNPATGAMTIHETEPLVSNLGKSLGVQDDRTIQISDQGKVALVTDDFVSTDGSSHTVSYTVSATVDDGTSASGTDLFQLPGQTGFQTYRAGQTASLGAGLPGTIYAYNDPNSGTSSAGYNAITYFSAPSGPLGFYSEFNQFSTPAFADTPEIPFTLNVPAGGSQSLSVAFATDYQQSALQADLPRELDLVTPPTITINSPTAGASESAASVTVSGTASAATGVASVSVNGVGATLSGESYSASIPLSSGSNTITALLTTNSGATASSTETVTYTPATTTSAPTPTPQLRRIWLPVADTGSARRAGRHYERLTGRLTAGTDGVSYYFAYGVGRRLTRRSRIIRLRAGDRSRAVAATVGRLAAGRRYHYRLVVFGKLGRSLGRSRTFLAFRAVS